MFRNSFRLNLSTILAEFKTKDENNIVTFFEVLSALRTIINDNMVLLDKYSLPCYLREEGNVYFLVNNIAVGSDFFAEYYTNSPHIDASETFLQIMESLKESSLPKMIQNICDAEEKRFVETIDKLPDDIQEMFIEGSIMAKDRDVETDIRDRVLAHYEGFIKTDDRKEGLGPILPRRRHAAPAHRRQAGGCRR